MKKKTIFLCGLILSLLYSSCLLDIDFKNNGAVTIKKVIRNKVDSILHDQECLPINVSNKGYCTHTDCSLASNYFTTNALCSIYKDTSSTIDINEARFAFAYKDSVDKKLYIQINRGHNGNNIMKLGLVVERGSFKSNLTINEEEKTAYSFMTEKCDLILDKPNYQIGDTLRGITFYQGLEWEHKINWWKYKIYFKCIVGQSNSPLDYIETYPKCEGLVNELGFGKSRNIIAPKLEKKKEVKKYKR
jgi:hypothetical protein